MKLLEDYLFPLVRNSNNKLNSKKSFLFRRNIIAVVLKVCSKPKCIKVMLGLFSDI